MQEQVGMQAGLASIALQRTIRDMCRAKMAELLILWNRSQVAESVA
jgi:hypothetical protein